MEFDCDDIVMSTVKTEENEGPAVLYNHTPISTVKQDQDFTTENDQEAILSAVDGKYNQEMFVVKCEDKKSEIDHPVVSPEGGGFAEKIELEVPPYSSNSRCTIKNEIRSDGVLTAAVSPNNSSVKAEEYVTGTE